MTLGTSLARTVAAARAVLDQQHAAHSTPTIVWRGLSEPDSAFAQRLRNIRAQLPEHIALLAITPPCPVNIVGARLVLLAPKLFALLHPHVPSRYRVGSGGRGSGRSYSFATALVLRALTRKTRILACREVQRSLRESVHQLLCSRIEALGLTPWFDLAEHSISCVNGSEVIYAGLKDDPRKLKSIEDIGLAYVEEAEGISDRSLEILIPTIRATGSEIWLSLNPDSPEDPVYKRFIAARPPDCRYEHVTFADNPWFPAELERERAYLESVDDDSYQHVWLGKCRQVSDAIILRGKFVAEEFEVRAEWSGPHHGLDYGFSRDPSAGVRLYVDDEARVLYVDAEFWALNMDIDALPKALEASIPGIGRHVVHADAARPESTSFLARHGIPNARSAAKWAGSVDDGIAYLRSFAKIVVNPRCKYFLDECRSYSFKVDRLSGLPLPEPLDKSNHLIDATRYALVNLIRNQPSGTFFSHKALLLDGEPVDSSEAQNLRPMQLFATVAACDRPGSAVGLIWWSYCQYYEPHERLRVLDYDLVETEDAVSVEWFAKIFERGRQLRAEWRIVGAGMNVHLEEGALFDALTPPVMEYWQRNLAQQPDFDLIAVETDRLGPPTLDERADMIRPPVNSGQFVKLGRQAYTRQLTHRSVTVNHLTSQILGFRTGVKDIAAELTNAFVLGCLLTMEGQH
jgi:phage terminase large subunit